MQLPPPPPPTARLTFTHLDPSSTRHCEFLVSLYTSPLFLSVFKKSPVSTPEEAAELMRNRFLPEFERNGYGKWIVVLKPDPDSSSSPGLTSTEEREEGALMGVMGFSKREGELYPIVPDLGFAFLPEYTGKGYATEAARGLLEYAHREIGLDVIFGFTDPDNTASRKLMERAGLEDRGTTRMKCFGLGDDGEGIMSKVYVTKGAPEDLTVYKVGV